MINTAIIVDDEEAAHAMLQALLREIGGIDIIGNAYNVDDAIDLILKTNPDLIFLDVELSGKNGFELIHEMQCYDLSIPFIFTTAFNEFAVEAFRHSAVDYLLKPIIKRELINAIEKFRNSSESGLIDKMNQLLAKVNRIKLKFNYRTGYILIDSEEIVYCKGEGNYTNIILNNDEQKTVTMKIGEVFDLLIDKHFIRPGRSIVINPKYLSKVDRKQKSVYLSVNNHEIKLNIPRNKFGLIFNLY